MKNILPALAKTFLLYGAAVAALYISDRFNPSAGEAGIGQSILVLVAVASVLLIALFYAFYKAIKHDSQWWAVVGLHFLLIGVLFVWLAR